MGIWNDAKNALGMKGAAAAEDADPVVTALVHVAWARSSDMDEDLLHAMLGLPEESRNPIRDRREWIEKRVRSAFTHPLATRAYRMDGVLGREVRRALRDVDFIHGLLDRPNMHLACEEEAFQIALRFKSLCSSGRDVAGRIEAEADILAREPDASVHLRFGLTPPARMDALPASGPERRKWICDMLFGENAMIRTGAISTEKVFEIVRRMQIDFEVPISLMRHEGAAEIVENRAYHPDNMPWRRLSQQADHLATQPQDFLRNRFKRAIEGGHDDPPQDPVARSNWIRRALAVEHVRRIAGLAERDVASHARKGLSIELLGVTMDVAEDGTVAFEGTLFVDGRRICDVRHQGGGKLEHHGWTDGSDMADIKAIDHFLEKHAPAREAGGPDGLFHRLLDQVAMRIAVEDYESASRDKVLFLRSQDEPEILSVPIPEGGSRMDAVSFIRREMADAVLLEEMDVEDAALIWTTRR